MLKKLTKKRQKMVEGIVVMRAATKHINLWICQLEMKRKEICELALLMGLKEVKKDVEEEKSLERWAKRCSHPFTKKVKRMSFEEIDNMVWGGCLKEITQWCRENKVYVEIRDEEIEEIWNRETPDQEEAIRLNGKCVLETAKRVCEFINTHEDLISITAFGE